KQPLKPRLQCSRSKTKSHRVRHRAACNRRCKLASLARARRDHPRSRTGGVSSITPGCTMTGIAPEPFEGLDTATASVRLAQCGWNELPAAKPRNLPRIAFGVVTDPMF